MPKAKAAVSAKKSQARKKDAGSKTVRPKKKAVAVDIINDEPLAPPLSDFSFPDLPVGGPENGAVESDSNLEPLDIDQQKRFFSDLVSDMKDKEGAPSLGSKKIKKSVSLYRRLVVKFIILVLILAGLVAYFSFSKLTITITPQGETLKDSLLLKVGSPIATTTPGENDPREAISGAVQLVDVQAETTYPASGENLLGQEISGQVKIINRYTKDQSLVATTRLLSPDNKLFRIKEAVNVPAGGEVSVAIYADKPSADLAINPTTFTIPGLWAGLQDKIYAQSLAPFTFQQKASKYIKASDIQRASEEADNLLLQQAENQLASKLADEQYLYTLAGPVSLDTSAKADDQQASFTAKASGQVAIVSFPKAEAVRLATSRLNLLVPDDKELIEFNEQSLTYSLEDFDSLSGMATIKVSFAGVMALENDSEIIDRRQLVNLSAAQIDQYLKDFPGLKNYELKFSPSFIKKAPNLVDRIEIKINKIN